MKPITLKPIFSSPRSVVALAWNGNSIIGATTGIHLEDEEDAFREPFAKAGFNPSEGFYFGESVVLKEWRGFGLGKDCYRIREDTARRLGCKYAALCTVVRAANHSSAPKNYQPLDTFWHQQGFSIEDGLRTVYSWRDIGDDRESEKQMQFWIKRF